MVWTGAVAAGVNLLAASGALVFARSRPQIATLTGEADAATARPVRITRRPARLLSATFLCGAVLLALEVVWFRLLLLFVGGTSRAFAVMLAVVLAGIALGSLAASTWKVRNASHETAVPVDRPHVRAAAGIEVDGMAAFAYHHDGPRGVHGHGVDLGHSPSRRRIVQGGGPRVQAAGIEFPDDGSSADRRSQIDPCRRVEVGGVLVVPCEQCIVFVICGDGERPIGGRARSAARSGPSAHSCRNGNPGR